MVLTCIQVLNGEPVNQQCDVYSYGMVLYEILTGKLPFQDESDWMVPQLVVKGKVCVYS